MNSKRILKAISAVASLALLAACSSAPNGVEPAADTGSRAQSAGTAPAAVSLKIGKVGALTKGSAISMRKLILWAVSGGTKPDTVRDTSLLSGSDQQAVKRTLKLKPKSSWVLYAKTLDARDSIIHQGASPEFSVKLSDTTEVTLVLQSRFTMYTATFDDLPLSVGFGDEKSDRVGVAITRLVLKVDGTIKADSTAKEWFGPDKAVVLAFDYVTVGSHDIVLEAYGQSGDYKGILYTGAARIATVAGEDGSRPISMAWMGPSTGAGHANIIVGKVGKMDLKPDFPDKL